MRFRPSSLLRMQVSRNFESEQARNFLSEAKARTWLMDDIGGADAAVRKREHAR